MEKTMSPISNGGLGAPVLATSAKSHALCSAIDHTGNFKDFGISYISSTEALVCREPKSLIQNRIIITPASRDKKPTTNELRPLLEAVGVDCMIAVPLSYAATAATCGGTVVTMGIAAPLCALSTVGAGVTSLKCGHAIGKLTNHIAIDPTLNEYFDRSDAWKHYETAVDAVDILAASPGVAYGIKNIGKLSTQAAKYGKAVPMRYSIFESKRIYRELAEALGETFSNQGVKRWVNQQGLSPRFSPSVISGFLKKEILALTHDLVGIYDNFSEINKRTRFSNELPTRPIVKGIVHTTTEHLLSPSQNSSYSIHFVQQVKP